MQNHHCPTWGQQSSLRLVRQNNPGRLLKERLAEYTTNRMATQGLDQVVREWAWRFDESSHGYTVTFTSPSKATFVIQGICMNAGGWPFKDMGIAFYPVPRTA